MKKHLGLLTVLAVIALTVFFYFRFFFVFGEGVKSGELNYVVYKGVLFKTYEGKLIQTGIRSKEAGSIQSYEFEFSVEDPALARELMLQGGRTLELHYKEYFGALPWRGFTKFIVDSIVTIGPPVRRGVELPPVQPVEPPKPTGRRCSDSGRTGRQTTGVTPQRYHASTLQRPERPTGIISRRAECAPASSLPR